MSVIYVQGGGGGATVPDATTTVVGKVRLATIQEAQGNSEAIAVTPAGVQAAIAGIVGGMTFKGTYDAALSTPPLENAEQGDYYLVSNVKVNPTDTNTTYTRFGIEWAVGDHLVITEDMGGTIVDSRISKVDNSETVAQLNDLLDVTEALSAAGHVLIHDGTDYKNRALTTADIVGLAQHLYALLDVSLNELTSASYTTSTASLSVVASRDYTIDIQGYADPATTPPTPYIKDILLPASLNDDHDEIRIVNIGQGALNLQVQGSAVFYDATDPLLHNTTPVSVNAGVEVNLVGEVRTYTVPDPANPGQTIQVNKTTWYVNQSAVPSRMSLVRTGSNDWTNGFLTAADIVGVVTQGEREALQQELDRTQAGAGLNADGTLTVFAGNFINTNTTLRQAIQNLDTALKSEETARIAADSSEASARAAGDAGLQSQITQEINDRSAGDANLQGQINALATIATTGASADASVAHTAVAYTPSAATAEAHIAAIDGALNTVLSTNVLSVNSETPTLGDVFLDGTHIDTATTANNYTVAGAQIDQHLDGIDSELGTIKTDAATEEAARIAADNTEASARAAGDANLQGQINALATVATTGAAADVSVAHTALSYTPTSADVEAHIVGLDAQVNALGSQIVSDVNGEVPVNGSVTIDGTHVDTATTANNYTVAGAQIDQHLDGIDTKLGDLQTELDTTQAGAGLNADGTYTANAGANYIAAATSLKAADNALDSAIKSEETARIAGDNALQTELDDTQTGAGLATDGSYTANAGANYIAAATSLANADDLLDAAIATLSATNVSTVNSESPDLSGNVLLDGTHIDTATTANNYTVAGAQIDQHLDGIDTKLGDLQTELDATQTGAGLNADGSYTANAGTNYLTSATSLKGADEALDTQLKATQDELDETQTGAGLNTDGTYTAPTGTKHLGAATDLNNADVLLDAALATPNATNYTGTTTDTISTHLSGIDTALTTINATNYTGATTDDLATHLGGIDTALGLKAPIDSPTFTTAANAPTPAAADNSTSIATTAFVQTEIANLSTTAGGSQYQLQVNDGSSGFAAAQWEVDASNHLKPLANDQYDIGSATYKVRDLYLGSNSLKLVDDAVTPNVISVSLTSAAHGHGENHVQTTDGVVAIVNADAAITDPVLAKVASTGSYSDLVDAPDSIIATSAFETTVTTYNLESGKHYTFFTAAGGSPTVLVVPDTITGSGTPRGGDAIRITNWGNGELKITTSGSSGDTWLQYSQTLSKAQTGQGATQPEFIVESRTTIDLYGWSYISGGTTYNPAWGIYFMPSMEINTKSLTTSGQMLVYDQTNDELVAGGLGDLSTTFAPTNYDNTVGATVVGDKIDHHLEGIDNKLALGTAAAEDVGTSASNVVQLDGSARLPAVDGSQLINLPSATVFYNTAITTPGPTLAQIADSRRQHYAITSYSPGNPITVPAATSAAIGSVISFYNSTTNQAVINCPGARLLSGSFVTSFTVEPNESRSLVWIGAGALEELTATRVDRLNGVSITSPSNGEALVYNGTSGEWENGTVSATVANLYDVGDVDSGLSTTPPTDGDLLTWDNANTQWIASPASAPLVAPTSASPAGSYSITTSTGAEEIYLLTPSVACAVSIPAAPSAGFRYNIKNLSTNAITITPASGTIDGAANVVLSVQYSSVTLLSDGTNYFII